MSDFIVKQIATVVGNYVASTIGSQVAGTAVAAAIGEAEIVNLINNIQDGRATAADVIAVTAAIEGVILGAGTILTTAGVITGIGVSIPLVGVAVAAMGAWFFTSAMAPLSRMHSIPYHFRQEW